MKINTLFNSCVEFLFKILRIKDKRKKESILQFIRFGIVGFSNVAVSYVINVIVLLLLNKYSLSYDFVIGNVVAFILSVLWSFYWNNKFVFKNENNSLKNILIKLLKTYVVYSFSCLILNNVLSFIWIDMLKISKYIAPLINLVVTIPINFILNKIWAFKK